MILIGLVGVIVELVGAKLMTPTCEIGRSILLGRENVQLVRSQNTIGQSYLNYICAPNYSHPRNGPQHNADGYRGKAVPFDRQPGVLCVLCLGGSTTYGWGVPSPDQTYPAMLEELLRTNLPQGYGDVEVLNGGIPYGTSAEILTHYHFKYHYYRPDIVIINEGGNDAQGHTTAYYHPDNSNWRFPIINLRPLPPRLRWLARSRLVSYIMLNVFYVDQITGGQLVDRDGVIPPAPWFKIDGRLVNDSVEIPYDKLAFAHNMETLIQEILFDGARVLLVPFRAAPGVYETNGKDFELGQILRNERILKNLAQKYQVGFAPFPADVITFSNWTDHCHLNAAGERQKAGHITPYVLSLLSVSNRNDRAQIQKGQGQIIARDGSQWGYAYEALALKLKQKIGEPFLLTIRPGDPKGKFQHGGQEFIYMLSGRMEFTIDGTPLQLHPGDSLYFDATLVHTTRGLGKHPARFLCMFMRNIPKQDRKGQLL